MAGKDTRIAESYGHPVGYASECLVRALDHRIHVVMEDNPKETKRRENIVNSKTQAGLLLTEPFYRLLADYEQSELNFEEFVSEMLQRLPEYHD
jgi:hypothetical protein